jgi:S-adenosylmethionine synthetase
MTRRTFTSESVTEGHPDKICDQISDTILDALLEQDPDSRVAVETLVTTGLVQVAGEVTTSGYVEIPHLVRQKLLDTSLESRSGNGFDEIGAGDQGMMFGYASNETANFMPAPINISHQLTERLSQVRRELDTSMLRPDGKAQVSVSYEGDRPVAVNTVVLSTQHHPDVQQEELANLVLDRVIRPVLQHSGLDTSDTNFIINPTGRFVIGGPQGDAGVTGRKIIVDTYGGSARPGGGAFSGKDPSKVDRSAAYAMRWVAKNLVAAGLADRAEIQVAYAIGVSTPVALHVETFGTEHVEVEAIEKAIRQVFDLRPAAIISELDLKRPIYAKTASYGHFGRELPEFTWENLDRVQALKDAAGR